MGKCNTGSFFVLAQVLWHACIPVPAQTCISCFALLSSHPVPSVSLMPDLSSFY